MLSSLLTVLVVTAQSYLAEPPRGMDIHLGQGLRFMYFLFPNFCFPLILLACALQLSNEFLMCFAFFIRLIVLNQPNVYLVIRWVWNFRRCVFYQI